VGVAVYVHPKLIIRPPGDPDEQAVVRVKA
jgi:hypothetical protein